jgi:hypothetical protein
MDWILVSNCISQGFVWFAIITFIGAIVLGIRAIVHRDYLYQVDDKTSEEADELGWEFFFEHLKKIIILAIFAGLFSLLGFIPKILIETNIDKVKLRYTDMEYVEKLEKGAAEKIVDKLERLIDKGIENIGAGNKESEEK